MTDRSERVGRLVGCLGIVWIQGDGWETRPGWMGPLKVWKARRHAKGNGITLEEQRALPDQRMREAEVTARLRDGFGVAVDGSITAYPGDLARAAIAAIAAIESAAPDEQRQSNG